MGGTPSQCGPNHKAIGDSTEHHKEGTAQGPALGTELQKQTLGPVQGNGDCDKIAEAPNRTTLERSQAKDLGGTTGTQEGPQLGLTVLHKPEEGLHQQNCVKNSRNPMPLRQDLKDKRVTGTVGHNQLSRGQDLYSETVHCPTGLEVDLEYSWGYSRTWVPL